MKKLTLTQIGRALEAFGVTITGYSAIEMIQWLLISGLVVMALGRALTAIDVK